MLQFIRLHTGLLIVSSRTIYVSHLNPEVTIAICCYNDAGTLARSLDSAIVQGAAGTIEILLVDDGSSDDINDVVKKYDGVPGFRYVRNERNEGLIAAANKALSLATAPLFMRLDADDYLSSSCIQTLLSEINSSEVDIVVSDRFEVSAKSKQETRIDVSADNVFSWTACGVLMKTELVRQIGGYRDFYWEEYDLFLRYLSVSGKSPSRITEPLYYYVRGHDRITGDKQRESDGWRELADAWPTDTIMKFGSPPTELSQILAER